MAKNFYGVHDGRETGVFSNWADAEAVVSGYSGAEYQGFDERWKAKRFAQTGEVPEQRPETTTTTASVDDVVDVYVDGSFKDGVGGWAFVVPSRGVDDSGTVDDDEALQMQSVACELAAAMRAVLWARKNDVVINIHHDNKGIAAWPRHNWKRKNEHTQEYAAFMRKHHRVIEAFTKVKAHSGVAGNECADALAKAATK